MNCWLVNRVGPFGPVGPVGSNGSVGVNGLGDTDKFRKSYYPIGPGTTFQGSLSNAKKGQDNKKGKQTCLHIDKGDTKG